MDEPRLVDLEGLSVLDALEVTTTLMGARLAVFPTDTVYGIGGSLRPEVGEQIVAAKGREPGRPLQVVFPNRELLLAAFPFSRTMTDVLHRLLPGPLTLVVPYPQGLRYPPPANAEWPVRRLAGLSSAIERVPTLGLRVPRWPEGARLMASLSFPLLASSANSSGGPAPATLAQVEPRLRRRCDLLLDGGPAGGVASTVADFSGYERGWGYRVLREGAVGHDEIDEMLTRKREDLPTP